MIIFRKEILPRFIFVLAVCAIVLFFAPKSAYAANIINFSLNPNSPNASNAISFTGTVVSSDNPPIKDVTINVDGSNLNICLATSSCIGTGGPYSVGSHTLTVSATDNLNNSFSSSLNFNVSVAPVCGDGSCNGLENCATCAGDCGGCPPPPPPPPPPCSPSACPGGCANTGQSRGCGLFCPDSAGTSCGGGDYCDGSTRKYNGICGGGTCNYSSLNCDDGNSCTTGDGCSGGVCSSGTQIAPTCSSFSFSPASINIAEPTALNWSATCADSGTIDNGLGNVSSFPAGSRTIYPVSDLTYNMTVTGPTNLSATCPSASITVTIPSGPECNDATDLMIAFDTTGSMGGEISAAQSQAMALMNLLDLRLGAGKVQYGVVEFRDYADGAPSYPYNIKQSITSDKNAVQTALDSLGAANGSDEPEANARVMYESYNSSADFGWRGNAQKFLIMITDEGPHDKYAPGSTTDTAYSVPSSGPNHYDPQAGISSDAIATNMKTNGIVLIVLDAGNNGFWNSLAQATGGNRYPITATPSDMARVITNAVLSVVGDKDGDSHFMNACGGDDCNDSVSGQYLDQPCFRKCFDNELRTGTCQGSPGSVECIYTAGTECVGLGDICKIDSCEDQGGTADDYCNADTGNNVCGGLIPCNRMVDNPATSWKENAPCNFCHLVMIFQLIVQFLIKLATVAAAFVIALGGLKYLFAAGDTGNMQAAKTLIKYSIVGFIAVFAAWVVIESILMSFGFIDPMGGKWFEVICTIS